MILNYLIWRLPSCLHERFLDLTGWRLVQVSANGKVRGYFWTDKYPAMENIA